MFHIQIPTRIQISCKLDYTCFATSLKSTRINRYYKNLALAIDRMGHYCSHTRKAN